MMKIFNNEELVFDMDDLMEQELANFNKVVKSINKDEIKQFKNWLKLYKTLNYDIIDSLEIINIFRFNACAAVIELKFNNKTEYDLLYFNAEDMTVSCMNVRKNNVRNYMVRRMLIPTTVEEALMYAKSELTEKTINSISKTIDKIKTESNKYMVTSKLIKHLNIKGKEQVKEEEPVVEEQVKEEEPVVEEQVKEEVKQEEPVAEEQVKEEVKQEEPVVEEQVKEEEPVVEEQVKEEVKQEEPVAEEQVKEEEPKFNLDEPIKQEPKTGLLVDIAEVISTPIAIMKVIKEQNKSMENRFENMKLMKKRIFSK